MVHDARLRHCGQDDGVQFDRIEPKRLADWVRQLRSRIPGLIMLAAGGINAANVAGYAATGVDALATSAMYFGKPADIGTSMSTIQPLSAHQTLS